MTVDLKQDTLTGIHAVYHDGPYDVGLLGRYLVSLENAWCSSLATAGHRTSAPRPDGPTGERLKSPHTNQLLRPRVGTRLEPKLQTAQSTPLKISGSVSTSPWQACTDDGTCRLGHQVIRSSTSAKASHNPTAPICLLLAPSGEAWRKAWPPWRFEMRNGSPVAIFAGRQWPREPMRVGG